MANTRRFVLAAVIAAALRIVVHTQNPTPPPQQPTFRAGVSLVQVDAVALDRDNRPVPDLTGPDFDVRDDGAPMTLTSFKRIGAWESDRPPEPVRSALEEEREAARDDVRLFGIFLDEYHVAPMGQLSVVEPLIRFVNALPAADLAAVYTLGDGVRDVRLSRDREPLYRAIRTFEGRQGQYTPTKYPWEEEHLRDVRRIESVRLQVTLSLLDAIITHLGGIREGRKSLIVVSSRLGNPIELVSLANRYNVALYPLDPRGLIGFNASTGGRMSMVPMGIHDVFRVLADETGGRAIVARNDFLPALVQVSRDSSLYYLMSYESPHPTDGKFHHIAVRVKRPGVTVRARSGYMSLTPGETAARAAPPAAPVPAAVQSALDGLADALRPDAAEPARRKSLIPPPAAAPEPQRILGPPTVALLQGRVAGEPTARREFDRTERLVVRAPIADDPAPAVTVRLLGRTGQRLADLPSVLTASAVEVALPLGNLGPGDYVIELTARAGGEVVAQYLAFRVRR